MKVHFHRKGTVPLTLLCSKIAQICTLPGHAAQSFFPLGVWKWVGTERIRSYWKKKEFDVLNCLCYQQCWLYWNCISIIRLYLWYIFNWNVMCTVIGIMNPFQYKCITISECITIMSKLTDNTCWLESHTTSGSLLHHLQKTGVRCWISAALYKSEAVDKWPNTWAGRNAIILPWSTIPYDFL